MTPKTSNAIEPAIQKQRRIRFNNSLDVALVEAVKFTGAHLSPHGSNHKLYDDALVIFLQKAGSTLNEDITINWMTLYHRFCRIEKQRRDVVKRIDTSSGISVITTDLDQKLDIMIQEIDAKNEERRQVLDEQDQAEQRLVNSGRDLRNRALGEFAEDVLSSEERTPNTPTPTRRQLNFNDSDDEDIEFIRKNSEIKAQVEEKRFEIEKEKVDIEKKRDERDERKLKLDKERLELDKEKFKAEKEERSGILTVLKALADKLK